MYYVLCELCFHVIQCHECVYVYEFFLYVMNFMCDMFSISISWVICFLFFFLCPALLYYVSFGSYVLYFMKEAKSPYLF
jgi:hypothetical protein